MNVERGRGQREPDLGVMEQHLNEFAPDNEEEAAILERAKEHLEYHKRARDLQPRLVAQLAPTESLASTPELADRLVNEPQATEDDIARRVAEGGGTMEQLYWAFGGPPGGHSGLYVFYRLGRGAQTEDVIHALQADALFTVVQMSLLQTTSDIKSNRRLQARQLDGQED